MLGGLNRTEKGDRGDMSDDAPGDGDDETGEEKRIQRKPGFWLLCLYIWCCFIVMFIRRGNI